MTVTSQAAILKMVTEREIYCSIPWLDCAINIELMNFLLQIFKFVNSNLILETQIIGSGGMPVNGCIVLVSAQYYGAK